jgi:hypothetical protein
MRRTALKRQLHIAIVSALALAVTLAIGAFRPAVPASAAEGGPPAVHGSASAVGGGVAGIPPVPRPHGIHPIGQGPAKAGRNLLGNADLAQGAGDSPDDWRTGGWKQSPSVTGYDWLHSSGSEPELIVNNFQPNDARWIQSLSLEPGWYYISAQARTENVPSNAAGATISLDEDGIDSLDLRGTTQWQRIGFYLKVGKRGADVDVALRLGNFGSLNTGRAFFRKPEVVKITALPAGAAPVFDLAAIRRALMPKPVGHLWTLIATGLLLVILTIAGWNIYGTEELAPAPAPQRAERRRQDDSARRGKRR